MKIRSFDVTEYYDAEFAVMLSRLIGYHAPLIDRLRNHVGSPAQDDYFVSILTNPGHRWPTPTQVEMSREHLRRATMFLKFLWRDGRRGGVMKAYEHVATEFGISSDAVRDSVKYARKLVEWWSSVERLARKGKSESLRWVC